MLGLLGRSFPRPWSRSSTQSRTSGAQFAAKSPGYPHENVDGQGSCVSFRTCGRLRCHRPGRPGGSGTRGRRCPRASGRAVRRRWWSCAWRLLICGPAHGLRRPVRSTLSFAHETHRPSRSQQLLRDLRQPHPARAVHMGALHSQQHDRQHVPIAHGDELLHLLVL